MLGKFFRFKIFFHFVNKKYFQDKIPKNQTISLWKVMSKITIIPPSLNAAWNNLQNNFNEDILEYEEAQYEEELKMVSF